MRHRRAGTPARTPRGCGRSGWTVREEIGDRWRRPRWQRSGRVERKTWQADAFGAAYRAGELSWVRALTLLPIVAEPTAAAWVERAGAVPVRRLADEVEWALTVRDGVAPIAPPPPGASLALEDRQLCTRPEWEFPDAEVTFSAPVAVVALFRTAILAFAAHAHGSLIGGLESLLVHGNRNGRASHGIAIRCSPATGGAARSRSARRGGSCTIITSSSARAAAGTGTRTG